MEYSQPKRLSNKDSRVSAGQVTVPDIDVFTYIYLSSVVSCTSRRMYILLRMKIPAVSVINYLLV